MRRIVIVVSVALFLIACNRQPAEKPTISRIDINVAGKPSVMELKSGFMRILVRESPDPAYRYAKYCFTLGNFDLLDNKALERALKKDTARIIYFEILGPTGSTKETPLAPGNYTTDARVLPKFENLSLAIFTIQNGKQEWTSSKTSPAFDTHGEVKITAIEGDYIKGEINITTGSTLAARGNFIALRVFDKPGADQSP